MKVIPSSTPVFVIHYRTPLSSTWQFGSSSFSQPDYRHFATKLHTGVAVARPRGPLGFISVRLKPEAAACFLGERMQSFLDARIGLDDLFGASRVSLLEEMLAEARTSAERIVCMERFLAANLCERCVNPVACRAAARVVGARSRSKLGRRRLCGRIHRSGAQDQRFHRDRRRAAGATCPLVWRYSDRCFLRSQSPMRVPSVRFHSLVAHGCRCYPHARSGLYDHR